MVAWVTPVPLACVGRVASAPLGRPPLARSPWECWLDGIDVDIPFLIVHLAVHYRLPFLSIYTISTHIPLS